MTPSETVLFIRYVRACCPQQAIDEYTADAWHDVLACEPWLTLAEARDAVVQIKRRQPFADVSEVIAQAKAARSQRRELELAERGSQPGRRALEIARAEREKLPDPVRVSELLAPFRRKDAS